MRILSFQTRNRSLTSDYKKITKLKTLSFENLIVTEPHSFQHINPLLIDNLLSCKHIAITSKISAEWFAENLTNWQGNIYVNSQNLKNYLQNLPNVKVLISKSSYSKDLGEIIYQNNVKSFIHLTGNLGLKDLENYAKQNGINFQRLEVYKTIETPKIIDTNSFDVFIFTSPSQLNSFFSVNTWKSFTFALCIGATTALKAKQKGIPADNIYYPKKATLAEMLELLPEIEKRIEQQKSR